MPALIIGEEQRLAIRQVIDLAEAEPLDTMAMVRLAKVDKDAFEKIMLRFAVDLPIGYRAVFSHEIQPAGRFKHLSVSVDRPNKLPSVDAVNMIAIEFGIGAVVVGTRTGLESVPGIMEFWIEDVTPGHRALNFLQIVTPTAGHA